MKRYLLIIAALPVLALAAAACGDDDNGGTTKTAPASVTVSPSATSSATNVPTATPSPTPVATAFPIGSVCAANLDPATPDEVLVDNPKPGDTVSGRIRVTGKITAFEAQFRVTAYGADGVAIVDVSGTSSEGQTLAPFEVTAPANVTQATPVCLWVYEKSAKDGSPIHVLQVPITLEP